MAKITLSLGSNQGDREGLIEQADSLLEERIGPVTYRSEIVETPAWGVEDQPPFCNQVIEITHPRALAATDQAGLHAILNITQSIEAKLGRQRGIKWGPRTIDIDIIFIDDLRYEDERLSLPHPWWRHRSFVRDLLPASTLLDHNLGIFDDREQR